MVLSGRKLFFIFLVWMVVILLRMVWLAGDFSNWRRIEIEATASRTGVLPALRGTIFDGNGRKLAWSEKYYDLHFTGRVFPEEIDTLKTLLPLRTIPENIPNDFVITKLAPDEMLALDRIVKKIPALQITSRVERVRVDDAKAREQLGEIDPATGKPLSGWEKEFDRELSGNNGTFRVLLDRKGNWIDGTWEIREMPEKGRDIRVNWCLEAAK